jgi:hypothetical protein
MTIRSCRTPNSIPSPLVMAEIGNWHKTQLMLASDSGWMTAHSEVMLPLLRRVDMTSGWLFVI